MNEEAKRAYERAHYAKNKEAIAARKKAWRAARLEKIREASREYYAANKDKEAARNKAYRTANLAKHAENKTRLRYRKPEDNMLIRIRARAKERGLEFNLTVEDCLIPATCPALGIPLTLTGAKTDNTASMDRIDNAKGYVKGNVQILSWRANRIKNDAEPHELIRIAAFLLRDSNR